MAGNETTIAAEKPSGNTGLWIGLGILVLVNLVVGVMFAPHQVELHHAPVIQLPNFLAFLGVPGKWLPAHVAFTDRKSVV